LIETVVFEAGLYAARLEETTNSGSRMIFSGLKRAAQFVEQRVVI
jgi:hypothetical protein